MKNCWCGQLSDFNCTHCGAAFCAAHREKSFSQGIRTNKYAFDSLEDWAFHTGYCKAGIDDGWSVFGGTHNNIPFVCFTCRLKDAADEVVFALQRQQSWPSDPFERCVTALRVNYGYGDLLRALSLEQIVAGWCKLASTLVPTQNVTVIEPISSAKLFLGLVIQPAQFGPRVRKGWRILYEHATSERFPHYTEALEVVHADMRSIYILTNGRLIVESGQTFSLLPHVLLPDMAWQLAQARGESWDAPLPFTRK